MNNKRKEFFRVLKFILISISAGIIQVVTYALIRVFSKYPEGSWQDYVVAYCPSLILSVIWNFTINRKVTFKAANNVALAMTLVLCFYAVFTPVSTILGDLATKAKWNEYLVLALTMISNFVLEYLFTRFVVYRKACDTAVKKQKSKE